MADCPSGAIDNIAYVAAAADQAASIVTEATIWAAVQTAVYVWQRWTKGKITDIRQAQAERRMVIAEEILAHAQESWAKEQAFVADAMAAPLNAPLYAGTATAKAYVDDAAEASLAFYDGETQNKGLTFTACDDNRMARGTGQIRSDLMAHSMRTAEARALMLNDRRYSRQMAAVALGRGKLRDAFSAGQLTAAGAVVRNTLIGSINSAMQFWGYMDTRWQTGGKWAASQPGSPALAPPGGKLYAQGIPGTEQPPVSIEVVQTLAADGNP